MAQPVSICLQHLAVSTSRHVSYTEPGLTSGRTTSFWLRLGTKNVGTFSAASRSSLTSAPLGTFSL